MPPTPKPAAAAAPPPRRINWREFGAAAPAEDRQTWRPSIEGDHITGRLASVKEATTKFGQRVVVELTSCTDVEHGGEAAFDGDYIVWPTQGLLDALDSAGIDEDERVTINLVRLIDTGRGSPFKQFDVERVDESF